MEALFGPVGQFAIFKIKVGGWRAAIIDPQLVDLAMAIGLQDILGFAKGQDDLFV